MNRPIVYGAQYYFSGRRVSHSHLYRTRYDGTGQQQLTSGKADDTYPAWSPNGRWIAFSRQWQNKSHPNAICMIPADGGQVRTVFPVGNIWIFSVEWLSKTHLLVHCMRESRLPGRYVSFIVPIATGKPERLIYHTREHALSPDRKHLTAWSDGFGEDTPTLVIRLKDGHKVRMPKEVGGTCVWLDNERFVALSVDARSNLPLLLTCSCEGKVLKRVGILGSDTFNPSFLDPFPGRRDIVLVGEQQGGSTDGRWAITYQVSLQTGLATAWAETNTIVSSPDNQRFLTTHSRDLVEIPGSRGSEYGAPLLLATIATPAQQRPLISGKVFVEGFDWH